MCRWRVLILVPNPGPVYILKSSRLRDTDIHCLIIIIVDPRDVDRPTSPSYGSYPRQNFTFSNKINKSCINDSQSWLLVSLTFTVNQINHLRQLCLVKSQRRLELKLVTSTFFNFLQITFHVSQHFSLLLLIHEHV